MRSMKLASESDDVMGRLDEHHGGVVAVLEEGLCELRHVADVAAGAQDDGLLLQGITNVHVSGVAN